VTVVQLPAPRKINCPACGFSISATAKTCDFCGYELEPQMDDSPSSQAFRSDAFESSARPPVSGGGKNGNGKKNAGRSRPPNVREQETEPERITQGQNAVPPAAVEAPAVILPDVAEKRIKELEKQLSDAEKELDVISKILAETSAAEAGENAVAPVAKAATADAVQKLPERVNAADLGVATKSKAIVPERGAVPSPVHEYRKAKGTGLRFRAKAVTAVSIVVGLALYLTASAFSAQLGAVEGYFLLIAGTVLVSLGLYSSFEPSEAQGRRTAA
jgi:hypothetical protein